MEPGTKLNFPCPVCGGGSAYAKWKVLKDGSEGLFIDCWSLECQDNPKYLGDLAEALNLHRGATKEQIAEAAGRLGRTGVRRLAEPPALPSWSEAEQWHARLFTDGKGVPLRYLIARGLSLDVIRAELIGWDGRSLTFPMVEASGGEMAGFKRRAPRAGGQMINWPGAGRPWPLYPSVDSGKARALGWTLIVAGEFDALAALSVGLPASSVTLGAGYWRDEWTETLAGLRVVVCFDNNEGRQTRVRARDLRAAGVDARWISLRGLGLDSDKGDLSDYLLAGGDPARLRRERVKVKTRASA